MPPRKRRQPTSPRTTRRSKRTNISNSPQSQWSDILSPAPPSNLPTPEGLQPHDYAMSASPSSDFLTVAVTCQEHPTTSHVDTITDHEEAIDALSTSIPFMDWLEAQVGSYEAKRRSSLQLHTPEPGLMEDPVTSQTDGKSLDPQEEASSGQGRAAKGTNSETKGKIIKSDEDPADPTGGEPEVPSHAHQPSHKNKSKSKRGKTPTDDVRGPVRTRVKLSREDVKLAKALTRIGENHELTRGLLFLVAQQVVEARKLILEADQKLQESRRDSMYNPDYFQRRPTLVENIARAIVYQESALANILDNVDSYEIHEGMPRDQPNEHPVGTDRPAHVSTSVTETRDRRMFNENIFQDPVQRADKPSDITTPGMTDMKNMRWQCGHCSHWNQPSKEDGSNVPIGSVQGMVQKHRCESCSEWLLGDAEMLNATQHEADKEMEREAEMGANPRAVPIPGKEPSRKSTTDVLAGVRFRAA